DASRSKAYPALTVLNSNSKSLSSNRSSAELARLSVQSQQAELFLERLANLDCTDEEKVWTFAKRFSDLLPTQAEIRGLMPDDFYVKFGFHRSFLPHRLQPQLRNIWKEPAPLRKEAGLMVLGGTYMMACSPLPLPEAVNPARQAAMVEIMGLP